VIPPAGESRTLPIQARPSAMTEDVFDEWLDYLAANMPEDQSEMVRRMMRDIPYLLGLRSGPLGMEILAMHAIERGPVVAGRGGSVCGGR